jgi:hypothetical protein
VSDRKVIEASRGYVRLIIRRPHAYQFRAVYKRAPIPGIAILDAEGGFVDGHDLKGEEAAAALAEFLTRLQ